MEESHDNSDSPSPELALAPPASEPNTIYRADLFAQAHKWATQLAESDMVPVAYRNKHANCMVALEMSARLGIGPLQVMQNMYIVHGQPAWSAQFVVALINGSGLFGRMRYRMGDSDRGRWCEAFTIELATGETLDGPRVDMQLATDEGWISRKGSKWKTMPEMMLRYRAASWFGRMHCPEIAMGMYASDEVESIPDAEWRRDYRDAAVDDDSPTPVREPTPAPRPADPRAHGVVDEYMARAAKLHEELATVEDKVRALEIVASLQSLQRSLDVAHRFVDDRVTAAIKRLDLGSVEYSARAAKYQEELSVCEDPARAKMIITILETLATTHGLPGTFMDDVIVAAKERLALP